MILIDEKVLDNVCEILVHFLDVRDVTHMISRNCRISSFFVMSVGVPPNSSWALGLSVKGVKILTISVCPLHAAQKILMYIGKKKSCVHKNC